MSSIYQDNESQHPRVIEKMHAAREAAYDAEPRRDHGHSFPDHPLHARIAEALGWTNDDVRSFSLAALRDLVRPVNAKLAYLITLSIEDLCT